MLNRRNSGFHSISLALAAALAVGALANYPAAARAEDADPKGDVSNSRFQFEGEINQNAVFVHSGPGENDYATTKLDRGAHVTVVGIRFDWLKIVPPEGSFCYVAKAFTERRDNGSVGRVTNAVIVHNGSDLNEMKVHTATRLEPNTDVEIIGEAQEYFKIKPPAGVYLYVNKQYVTPIRAIAVKSTDPIDPATAPPIAPPTAPRDIAMTGTPTTQPMLAGGLPSTQPSEALAPTTQPDSVAAQAEFDKLEATFAAESAKPLDAQHPAELAAGYDRIAKSGQLPDSMRRIAEYKAAALKVHADDRVQYLAVKKQQDEAKARMASLVAERRELETRVKQTEIKSYAAVGTLRPSSLQQGQIAMYRLTDPSTGRTVMYIRTNDDKIGTMMNTFVGVKGTVTDDTNLNLKLIEPTAVEPVDSSKLYTSVMSEIIPPSLQPAGQASLGNQ